VFLEYEDRKETEKRKREKIRALVGKGVEADLRQLAEAGYREDELMWAYEKLLRKHGAAFPGDTFWYVGIHRRPT